MSNMSKIFPVVDAFREYTTFYSNMGADYSVTDLLKPPKIMHLMRRHRHELPPQEPESIVDSFIGSGVHNLFEFSLRKARVKRPDGRDYIVEQRLWDKFLERKVTGKFDVWCDEILYDFKVTKTWKYIFGDFEDYEKQLNLYSFMASLIGIETRELYIIALFKDFQKGKTFDKGYPKEQILLLPIKHWTRAVQEKFLLTRLQSMIDAESVSDEELPDCTDRDRWLKDEKWAVMEPGKTRATRLLDSEAKVDSYLAWRKKTGKELTDYSVDHRPGSYMRCESYCPVRQWCTQMPPKEESTSGL